MLSRLEELVYGGGDESEDAEELEGGGIPGDIWRKDMKASSNTISDHGCDVDVLLGGVLKAVSNRPESTFEVPLPRNL